MADHVDCLMAVEKALAKFRVEPGSVTHTVAQLQDAFRREAEGFTVFLERTMRKTFTVPGAEPLPVFRRVDAVAKTATARIHTETKTGTNLARALEEKQLFADAVMAVKSGPRRPLQNVWQLSDIKLGTEQIKTIQKQVESLAGQLLAKGLTKDQVARAIESFDFVGAAEGAFRPALRFLFKEDGLVATTALREVSNSPDFRPAMKVLFGADGSVAWAASEAAREANLKPAMTNLEKQIETGVVAAMDVAAAKAEEKAKAKKKPVGEQVQAGLGALGKGTKAIPELYESISKLGEAWQKPLRSTKDYMDLVSAVGGSISQAGEAMEALAGLTKVATAAQAAFNFVASLNPITLIVIAVVALIAAIVAVYLYWDQVKLAFLRTANAISIGVQRIGGFFAALREVVGQVWAWIAVTAANVGIAILNVFIRAGVGIQNFFVGMINDVLGYYNFFANSVIGKKIGLEAARPLQLTGAKAKEIAPLAVPKVDATGPFGRAFAAPVTGALTDRIAAAEKTVAEQRKKADEERKAKEATAPKPPEQPAAAPPAVPSAAAAGADRSVTVNGGITVNINADKLTADSATLLSDEIVRQLQRKLAALRSEQDFRTGARAVMA